MTKTLLVLALILTGCTANRAIGVLTVADTALFACDATQTYTASNGGSWNNGLTEGDAVQGNAPSGGRMYGLMALNVGVAAAIAVAPIPKWIRITALTVIGLHVANTVNNNRRYVGGCGL